MCVGGGGGSFNSFVNRTKHRHFKSCCHTMHTPFRKVVLSGCGWVCARARVCVSVCAH